MGPEALAQVLRPLQDLFGHNGHVELLVGLDVADDAAIYKLNDEQAIINTLDFFTPVVDDPYDFGAIAAANSMSDVYAMGGEVVFALNVGGFPGSMDPAIVTEILRGGAEKVIEAGAVIAGGHTINDDDRAHLHQRRRPARRRLGADQTPGHRYHQHRSQTRCC
jgi:selenide,water dikinase